MSPYEAVPQQQGPAAECPTCDVFNACLPLGVDETANAVIDRAFCHPRRLARRETLYRAGEPLVALHAIRTGSLKSVTVVEDGREQITGYHMAGDIVGLDGLGQALHSCDVVALEDSEVCSLPIARLGDLAQQPRLLQGLFEVMARDLRRGRDLIVLLGSMRADERLATFLLNLAQRQQLRGVSPRELSLRMTREEIASLLGVKLETVSRVFSRLQAEGLIEVHGRAVKLLDAAGLKRAAGQPA
jgi:CRP/FNR family transcriptional regulator, anaerobic regulatory protein